MKNHSAENPESKLADTTAAASDLHAEIDEMRRRLAALEARAPAYPSQTVGPKRHWPATPKQLALIIAGIMLAGATIVFGQSAVDSLFISKDGNVGIGTNDPQARLHVSSGGVKIGPTSGPTPAAGKELVLSPLSGTVAGVAFGNSGVFLKSDSASSLTTLGATAGTFLTIDNLTGNVGVGTTTSPTSPAAKFEIKDRVTLQDSGGRNYFKDIGKHDGKGLRVGELWNQYGVFAETGMGALGGADGVTLQNGGLTVNRDGNITTSGSINGEKQPYMFEVGDNTTTDRWNSFIVPSDIIKRYLGDADGGTIKICFRVNSSDEVRTITEMIYIEQPNKSKNATPGLSGWTRQEGGGDTGFVLGTTTQLDVIPHPWDWIYVRNYFSPEAHGGITGAAWTSEQEKYQLEFMTRPNVSATVIIYDR